jgi:hypothetical protein
MFANQESVRSDPDNIKDEISLNFTVTSRDSRQNRQINDLSKISHQTDSHQVLNLALNELNKVNCLLFSSTAGWPSLRAKAKKIWRVSML